MLMGSGARLTCLLGILQVRDCVTLGTLPNLSEPGLPVCIEGTMTVFSLGLDEIIYLARGLGHN